ncbi:hypothetical protein Q3G72_001029 [Acer saccharum]|nr:hypothetical protein Q3G72_001029 [Acer saccharum]
MFDYNDLIIDPRNLEWMREANCPVASEMLFCNVHLGVLTQTTTKRSKLWLAWQAVPAFEDEASIDGDDV